MSSIRVISWQLLELVGRELGDFVYWGFWASWDCKH